MRSTCKSWLVFTTKSHRCLLSQVGIVLGDNNRAVVSICMCPLSSPGKRMTQLYKPLIVSNSSQKMGFCTPLIHKVDLLGGLKLDHPDLLPAVDFLH